MKTLVQLLLVAVLLLSQLPLVTQRVQAQQVTFTPTCAGGNDTPAFQTIITGAAGNPRTIRIPYKRDLTKRCAVNTLTIPSNITLDHTDGSGINRLAGQILTIQGPIISPPKQIFFGPGTVSFTGNKSIREFYSEWWGAIPDGVTDSTTAIQTAFDAVPKGQILQFLGGKYIVTTSITDPPAGGPARLRGVAMSNWNVLATATVIAGNFPGYIFYFHGAGTGNSFEDMYIQNGDLNAGGGIFIDFAGAPVEFSGLFIDAWRCITIAEGTATVLVENVHVIGTYLREGASVGVNGWGIYTRGHTQIHSADVIGHDNGIRAAGVGISIVGGRYEVNGVGMLFGLKDDDSGFPASDISVTGVRMEGNDTGIWLKSASNYTISGFSIQGHSGAPSGQSVYGILSDTDNSGVIQSGAPTGSFSKAAIKARGHIAFMSVGGGNEYPNAAVWDINNPQTCVFINSDYQSPDGTHIPNLTATQFVRSIGAADRVRGMKQGKNLRGINVAVASAATFVDIVFPDHQSGNGINTATVVVDGASTLPASTYYYTSTTLNEVGETSIGPVKTVAVAAGQRVDITFFGFSPVANTRRRVYRGITPGVYDGYFDLPLESSATFSDVGQAFTGKQTPPTVEGADGTEPDAVYGVTVSPAWSTTTWISNKATSGFRINFGTAPGADSTLDWHLIR